MFLVTTFQLSTIRRYSRPENDIQGLFVKSKYEEEESALQIIRLAYLRYLYRIINSKTNMKKS